MGAWREALGVRILPAQAPSLRGLSDEGGGFTFNLASSASEHPPRCAAPQDIAAIEARNNRLERQARHNSALAEALDALLERLVLPPATERVLATANFTYAMCARMPRPGKPALMFSHHARAALHVPCPPPVFWHR